MQGQWGQYEEMKALFVPLASFSFQPHYSGRPSTLALGNSLSYRKTFEYRPAESMLQLPRSGRPFEGSALGFD